MLELVPIGSLYSERPFFLDFVASQDRAIRFLGNEASSDPLAPVRTAETARNAEFRLALRRYNLDLGAEAPTIANIDALASPETLCVQTGQQPGLLGGALFTLYKIVTAIRTARELGRRLNARVVPVYWLASQDHDLTEVNHLHWLNADHEVTSARFRWQEEGRRLDALPVTDDAIEIVSRYLDQVTSADASSNRIRNQFAPADTDSFCTWHARIWLRLFTMQGLIVADPCMLPPPTSFYRTALLENEEIKRRVSAQCCCLEEAGYPSPFPAGTAGGLFVQDENDRRVRVTDPRRMQSVLAARPSGFSPDAALRPILADWWFPTAVNVLGPGEIGYHAALRTVYPLFDLRQPPARFRLSLSILGAADRSLLQELGIPIDEVLARGIATQQAGWNIAPSPLRTAWHQARQSIDSSLEALGAEVNCVDPGLERSVGTARGGVAHALDRLEVRMLRAVLAKHGVSSARISGLSSWLRPNDRPQERVVALPELLARHGISLIDRILELEPWPTDCHGVWTVNEEG